MTAVAHLSGAIGLGSSEELLHELTNIEQQRSSLLVKKGNLMLQAAKQKATNAGVEDIHLIQQHGSLVESLIDMEDTIRVLVVGIRGESHEQTNEGVGRQLETIIRSLHKPILVVNKTFTTPQKIMLAYDGSDAANKALNMVASSPLFKNIPCHLVHVAQDTANDSLLEVPLQTLKDADIPAIGVVLQGKLEDTLTDYQASENIDLTVMGAFSHNRVRGFLLGSFTANMLKSTRKPLLLLR